MYNSTAALTAEETTLTVAAVERADNASTSVLLLCKLVHNPEHAYSLHVEVMVSYDSRTNLTMEVRNGARKEPNFRLQT